MSGSVGEHAEGGRPDGRPARSLWRGKAWFWVPWPILVALDLWSKAAVFGYLHDQSDVHRVFQFDWLQFELVHWGNPGTIWGLLQNATIPLMVLRCIAAVGLLWFLRATPPRARLQQVVLSLIFAGAIGNLYDNFTRPDRSVRDFLRFSGSWPVQWDFPAFNVADSCITVGAIALLLLLLREDRASARAARQVSS